MEIRKATAADAEKLLKYCKVIGAESDNLTFGAEGIPVSVEQEQAYLDSVYQATDQLYLVAVDGDEIVGTGTLSSFTRPRLAHRAEISVSVRKSMWGNHIGTRLMEEILNFAQNTGKIECISLEVRSDNQRAIALYKKFGFQKIGTFPGFMKVDGEFVSCDMMHLNLK